MTGEDKLNKAINSLSLLFPVRDESFHMSHKSVSDWLLKDDNTTSHGFFISQRDVSKAHATLTQMSLKL